MTIVRGVAVAKPLGRADYGALTMPTTVAKALAPALWSATGDPSLMDGLGLVVRSLAP
jgi:hypothetical protein